MRDVRGHILGAICLIGLAVSHGRQQLTELGEAVRTACEALCQDFGASTNQPMNSTSIAPETGA